MPLVRRHNPEPAPNGTVDWKEIRSAILARLNPIEEYAALGVRFTDPETLRLNGRSEWRECHAIDREDKVPSAAVNVKTWHYRDLGGEGLSLGFWSFALKFGRFGSFKDVLKHYAEKAGTDFRPGRQSSRGGLLEHVYEYRDAGGVLRYGAHRYILPNGKKDVPTYPIKNGTWFKEKGCMEGVRALPYRLPELLRADPEDPVLWLEGEKNCDRAWAEGWAATTTHGGATRAASTMPDLEGVLPVRSYYVVPDNDKGGRQYAVEVASYLHGFGCPIRIVPLPGLPCKGDLSDWFDIGRTSDELGHLLHLAPIWTPGDDPFATAEPIPEPAEPEKEETTGRSGRKYEFPLIVKGSTVKRKKVDWLLEDRVPYGFLTLFAGRTKVGKSFVTCDIVARLTTGGEKPLMGGLCFEHASCLIISEDDHEHVLVPRLEDAGADMGRVDFMSWEAMASFTLSDMEMLDDAYHASGEPKLVVIDPPTNFLGEKDEHKNAEVRGVLMKVSAWAIAHRIAVILITHTNKGTKKDMAAIDRIIGSVAWASTTRISHIFGPHPDEVGQYVWLPLGTNIGRIPDGLSYQIAEHEDGRVVIEWLGTVDVDADDMMAGLKKVSRGVKAVEWLAEQFRERREWPSDELKLAAREAGVSRNALFSPEAEALPIKKKPIIGANGDRFWVWVADEGWPPPLEPQPA